MQTTDIAVKAGRRRSGGGEADIAKCGPPLGAFAATVRAGVDQGAVWEGRQSYSPVIACARPAGELRVDES